MTIVLHLMPADAWRELADGAPITNPSLATEGFIHCTGDHTVLLQVANAFYASQSGEFVAVHIDTDLLNSECIWEGPAHIQRDGEAHSDMPVSALPQAPLFPHVYGPIDRRAVVGTQAVVRDGEGRFTGYAGDDAST